LNPAPRLIGRPQGRLFATASFFTRFPRKKHGRNAPPPPFFPWLEWDPSDPVLIRTGSDADRQSELFMGGNQTTGLIDALVLF
jgi:hypothetical protein